MQSHELSYLPTWCFVSILCTWIFYINDCNTMAGRIIPMANMFQRVSREATIFVFNRYFQQIFYIMLSKKTSGNGRPRSCVDQKGPQIRSMRSVGEIAVMIEFLSEPEVTFWQVCWFFGLMSGRCAWYEVIVMVTARYAVAGNCLHQFLTYCDKETFAKYILWWWQKANLINMFSTTFVPNNFNLKNKPGNTITDELLCIFN